MKLIDTLAYKPNELSFGTSGLRALVTDMTDLECYINTLGFLYFLKNGEGLSGGSVVYLAGDLRESTPRILQVVAKAIKDAGCMVGYSGYIPTPTVSYYALIHSAPCVMVTGSHIPDDRNGIKFCKKNGEVLKPDEMQIKSSVAEVRREIYSQDELISDFDSKGAVKEALDLLPMIDESPTLAYIDRYTSVFASDALAGRKIVYYQHSAVGRDLLPSILERLGASVELIERSDKFVSIDSENITDEMQEHFLGLAKAYPDAFAILSTDGDSDRPFVIDEKGKFHIGDVLGAVVASWLGTTSASIPVNASDAIDLYLNPKGIDVRHTKIGSPYVISDMQAVAALNPLARVVGWESNGGFLHQSDLEIDGKILRALPTRDALLPMIVAILAASEAGQTMSELFDTLPRRYARMGLIDNFPVEISRHLVETFSIDDDHTRAVLAKYFSEEKGFSKPIKVNTLDGARVTFENVDIAHMRPSSNAPQLRIYALSNTQERADAIAQAALDNDNGVFRTMEADVVRHVL